jgi:hypothetical protein
MIMSFPYPVERAASFVMGPDGRRHSGKDQHAMQAALHQSDAITLI